MSLIEGIGDEVTQFFIFITVILVVAWWTTNISDQRHRPMQTVFLIDRRPRRRRIHGRLTNHTQSETLVEATGVTTQEVETVEETPSEPVQNDERSEIVQKMDAATTNGDSGDSSGSGQSSDETRRRNVEDSGPSESNNSAIHIKLKYLNDELKVVEGCLQENLGDFKRRHFTEELASNKVVRLIFNGKLLHEDAKTLGNCGFFDNCVVHCLVHQKRNVQNEPGVLEGSRNFQRHNSNRRLPNLNNNNNQGRDSDLGNIVFALISFILGSAWYFRYVYAHLYTVTATVALVAITGIFTVVIIGLYFPDHESTNTNNENTQR